MLDAHAFSQKQRRFIFHKILGEILMLTFTADFRRVIGFLIITAALTFAVSAQDLTTDAKINSTEENAGSAAQLDDNALNAKNEFGVFGGFAPDIPRLFSGSRKSSYGEISFRYSRRLATTKNLAIKYQFDAIPLAVLNYRTERLIQTAPTTIYTRDRETAYAAGITPLSFQLNFRRRTKIQPFITAGAGLLIFGKKIPDDRSSLRPDRVGRRLNFTPFFGGGAEFLTDNGRAYTVGFKFHHISNNSTANINPGFDQNFFYFGYTFKKF